LLPTKKSISRKVVRAPAPRKRSTSLSKRPHVFGLSLNAKAPHGRHDNGHDRNSVIIHNAREHNLKNIDVRDSHAISFTVITGVSGSGKSTLAFDILFNEGQRRYLESLNAYARQFVQPASRPDVDAIYGIPPTVAIEQRTSRGGTEEYGCNIDGDLSLPATSVCETGAPSTARTARSADRATKHGGDCRAPVA
jgi:hypothetical protein